MAFRILVSLAILGTALAKIGKRPRSSLGSILWCSADNTRYGAGRERMGQGAHAMMYKTKSEVHLLVLTARNLQQSEVGQARVRADKELPTYKVRAIHICFDVAPITHHGTTPPEKQQKRKDKLQRPTYCARPIPLPLDLERSPPVFPPILPDLLLHEQLLLPVACHMLHECGWAQKTLDPIPPRNAFWFRERNFIPLAHNADCEEGAGDAQKH
ncbi:hypothetical protein K440DRAFT_683209 [Wilcoxina mikolae CBS 423.85]|nr:hypothetical protein K440DRAFT_683209 [Wilcoxina mikolae CBS 423.85]